MAPVYNHEIDERVQILTSDSLREYLMTFGSGLHYNEIINHY